jgi:hypothetical protein
MIRRKGISRIDQPEKHNHGWLVQVTFEGKTHRKWFSDNKHGGKKKAFAQALVWRDKTEKALQAADGSCGGAFAPKSLWRNGCAVGQAASGLHRLHQS